MKNFDIFKMGPQLQQEIKACNNAEELKALFAAKKIEIPDSKIEAVFDLSRKVSELDVEDLKFLAGGCECSDLTCDTDWFS